MGKPPWKLISQTDGTTQFRDGLCYANHEHMPESRQGDRPFPGYGIPMQPDRDTMEKISLFPDHIKPVFLHLRHPPHLLDEKNRAFDCSAKKKAAEAARGISMRSICSLLLPERSLNQRTINRVE